jgi:hypothetical protein
MLEDLEGYGTPELERELKLRFSTDPKLIAMVERSLSTVEPDKRETMRELLIETYICDLVLSSHAREAGF